MRQHCISLTGAGMTVPGRQPGCIPGNHAASNHVQPGEALSGEDPGSFCRAFVGVADKHHWTFLPCRQFLDAFVQGVQRQVAGTLDVTEFTCEFLRLADVQ